MTTTDEAVSERWTIKGPNPNIHSVVPPLSEGVEIEVVPAALLDAERERNGPTGVKFLEWLLAEARYERDQANLEKHMNAVKVLRPEAEIEAANRALRLKELRDQALERRAVDAERALEDQEALTAGLSDRVGKYQAELGDAWMARNEAVAENRALVEALERIARINDREEMTFGRRLDEVERIARAVLKQTNEGAGDD